jgi:ABC-type transporter Mla subunit MlaD
MAHGAVHQLHLNSGTSLNSDATEHSDLVAQDQGGVRHRWSMTPGAATALEDQAGTLLGMASPEIQRKVGQLRHDVDDVYELLDGTNELVTKIAGTQQRHGARLEEIQQTLDLTVGLMDRIEDTQRRQYETLNAKLDDVVALLRGNQPTDRGFPANAHVNHGGRTFGIHRSPTSRSRTLPGVLARYNQPLCPHRHC